MFELHQNEIVKFLIQQGVELRRQTCWGVTPLCLTREKNNRRVIELLEDRVVPEDLGALLVNRQWTQAENMLENQPDLIAKEALLIYYLIKCGLSKTTAWLINRHTNLEIRTKYKLDDFVASLTPLQGAISSNRVAIVKLLIKFRDDSAIGRTSGRLKRYR